VFPPIQGSNQDTLRLLLYLPARILSSSDPCLNGRPSEPVWPGKPFVSVCGGRTERPWTVAAAEDDGERSRSRTKTGSRVENELGEGSQYPCHSLHLLTS